MALTHEEKLLKAVETYSPINPVIKETINKNSRKQYRSWKSETKKQSPKVVANDMESGSKVVANDIDVIFNNLNISPLSNIGFTKEHLRTINSELKKLKLQFDPQRIQHSIYSLSHDLKNGKKFDSTPLNLFVGILKKGNIYNPTQNGYKNPEEEAERIYMESIKKGNEARKMAKEALYREKALEWYDHVDKDALRGDLVGVYGDSVPKSNALYKDMAIAYYLEHILEKG